MRVPDQKFQPLLLWMTFPEIYYCKVLFVAIVYGRLRREPICFRLLCSSESLCNCVYGFLCQKNIEGFLRMKDNRGYPALSPERYLFIEISFSRVPGEHKLRRPSEDL